MHEASFTQADVSGWSFRDLTSLEYFFWIERFWEKLISEMLKIS